MKLTVSLQETRQPFWIDRTIPAALGLYALAVIALQASGRMGSTRAITLLAVPILLWLATQSPALLVVGFVALPPGLLTSAPGAGVVQLTLLFAVALAAHTVMRDRLNGRMMFAVAPLLLLVAGAYFTFSTVDPLATGAATQFRRAMILYVVLFALAYVLARAGELQLTTIGTALLCSAGASAVIFLWQTNGRPWTYISTNLSGDLEPGLLFYRTHFGYMMAIGFAVALSRVLSRRAQAHPLIDLALLAFFSLMVTFAYTRGAWLVAFVLVTMIPFHTGKKLYWLLLPVIGVIAFSIPVVEERLLSDITGGLQRSLESGDLGTGRWGLWQELWDRSLAGFPLGQGFGYMWELSPASLFSHSSFTTEGNPFVYAHNDFLYWTVELGIVGLACLIIFWARIVGVVRRVTARARTVEPGAAFVGGVVLTMFVASMVDNGLFISAVAQRFFIVAGAAWAIAYARPETSHADRTMD
jgi:O-antigen ligase